jgi:5-methylcytosine-specific restriction protein A
VAATIVDHIVPHRGNQKLFWDSEHNWQSLCVTHHQEKTMRENQAEGRMG